MTRREGSYGNDVGALLDDYGDRFIIMAGFDGLSWRAKMKAPPGAPGNGDGTAGHELAALTCDELADAMDAMLAGVIDLALPRREPGASGRQAPASS